MNVFKKQQALRRCALSKVLVDGPESNIEQVVILLLTRLVKAVRRRKQTLAINTRNIRCYEGMQGVSDPGFRCATAGHKVLTP